MRASKCSPVGLGLSPPRPSELPAHRCTVVGGVSGLEFWGFSAWPSATFAAAGAPASHCWARLLADAPVLAVAMLSVGGSSSLRDPPSSFACRAPADAFSTAAPPAVLSPSAPSAFSFWLLTRTSSSARLSAASSVVTCSHPSARSSSEDAPESARPSASSLEGDVIAIVGNLIGFAERL